MVYILNKENKPLMPCSNRKARLLLKQNKAIVVKKTPFTIKLNFGTSGYKQNITLGIDSGSKVIGLSATTPKKVLFEGEVILRNDIVDLLSTRRELRKSRRFRNLRYRKPRFNNRVSSKNKGWLAPSIRQKIETHLNSINMVYKILPITNIVIEVASFDTQLLKAKEYGLEPPKGKEYQEGEMLKFWNTREYVLFRDNHTCRCCKGKSKDNRLNVHHIESRKRGGNAPNNLVTLCETCHNDYHLGKIKLPSSIKRGNSYKDAAFMGIMRWAFYNKVKETYELFEVNVSLTYGYITKNTRILNKLPKEHFIDARCISKNPCAKSDNTYYLLKKVRCHNRQIHKCKILKGGTRKLNQAPYLVKDFRLFDKVIYNKQKCFIWGRRSSGAFLLKDIKGNTIKDDINYKKLKLFEKSKYMLSGVQKYNLEEVIA